MYGPFSFSLIFLQSFSLEDRMYILVCFVIHHFKMHKKVNYFVSKSCAILIVIMETLNLKRKVTFHDFEKDFT